VRRSASEKLEIIHLVEQSELPVRTTLRQLGIASSTFYGWYSRFLEGGFDALQDRRPAARARWNKIPEKIRSDRAAPARLPDAGYSWYSRSRYWILRREIPRISAARAVLPLTEARVFRIASRSISRIVLWERSDACPLFRT